MPESSNDAFRELTSTIMDLMIHVGLITSVIRNYPEEIQENWEDRMRRYTLWADRQMGEIQLFGEAFDE